MKIKVVVKTNARKNTVERLSDDSYRVCVNAPPHEGKANKAVIELLADHFGVAKSCVRIASGAKTKSKWIEIAES